MKAERRHQLKQNSLSLAMLDLPGTLKQYSSTILLCLSAVFLVFALFYYRTSMKSQGLAQAVQSLAVARDSLNAIRGAAQSSPDGYIALRRQAGSEAEAALNQAASATTEPRILAEVLLARGDLNWELANTSEVPGATTRPSLKLDRSSADYLASAADAYGEVLAKYSDNRPAAAAAHFGLAAVDENKRDFDGAKKEYEAVANDPAYAPGIRNYAKGRLTGLPMLQSPVRIGTEAAAAAAAAAPAATTRPTAAAATPTTAPAAR